MFNFSFHQNNHHFNLIYFSTQDGADELGVLIAMENCFMVASSAFSLPEKYAEIAL